jgi:hypothetical protein
MDRRGQMTQELFKLYLKQFILLKTHLHLLFIGLFNPKKERLNYARKLVADHCK